jgi:hypothetical protein
MLTPFPNVALVFLPARIIVNVSAVVVSLIFLATAAGLIGSIAAQPPVVAGRIVKIAGGGNALVLGVDAQRCLGLAGNVDGTGVEIAFPGVRAVEVPPDFAARLDRKRDGPFSHDLLGLVGERQGVGPFLGGTGGVRAGRIDCQKP